MDKKRAVEIIEEMIFHERAWLKDFGRIPTEERIEALKMAAEELRKANNGKEQQSRKR